MTNSRRLLPGLDASENFKTGGANRYGRGNRYTAARVSPYQAEAEAEVLDIEADSMVASLVGRNKKRRAGAVAALLVPGMRKYRIEVAHRLFDYVMRKHREGKVRMEEVFWGLYVNLSVSEQFGLFNGLVEAMGDERGILRGDMWPPLVYAGLCCRANTAYTITDVTVAESLCASRPGRIGPEVTSWARDCLSVPSMIDHLQQATTLAEDGVKDGWPARLDVLLAKFRQYYPTWTGEDMEDRWGYMKGTVELTPQPWRDILDKSVTDTAQWTYRPPSRAVMWK